ncbi:ribonuclease P protein component [bacterium]|nr:ribonuclease P protein component [bacterium]
MSSTPERDRSGQERWSFSRSHHLKRKRLIEPLFNRNEPSVRSVAAGSIRLVYRVVSDQDLSCEVRFQIGVAVGRSAGPAVRRNRIKRVIREAIRLNQRLLHDIACNEGTLLTAMVIFRGNGSDISETPRDMVRSIEKLHRELTK